MKKFLLKIFILVFVLSFSSCGKLEKQKDSPKFIDYYDLYNIDSGTYLNEGNVYYIKNSSLYVKDLIKDKTLSFNLSFNPENYYVIDGYKNNFIFISKIKPKIYVYRN
ncbi:MAG TPA: hypothetical protein PL042_07690, partial [Caldisericia bacterium]|nr:hypothetical protein [Caldisericia bacterium]